MAARLCCWLWLRDLLRPCLGFELRLDSRLWLRLDSLRLAYHVHVKRTWLFWLLAVCLSGQALASSWAAAAVCPMWTGQGAAQWAEHETTSVAEPAQAPVATQPGLPDCCNDLLTYLSTGQSCKTGQDCATAHTWAPAQPSKVTPVLGSTTVRWPGSTAGKHASGPRRIWRPPTFY